MGVSEEDQPLLASISPTESLITQTIVESKRIWQIAGPSIFSRLAMFSMTVITQSFAGHLGMASALEMLCGQAYGAKQYHMLGIYLQRSWVVLFICSILLIPLFAFAAPILKLIGFCSILLIPLFAFAAPILKLIGLSSEVAEQTGVVALWLIPFHLSFPFQFTLQRFLQSQLKTAVIAWVSAAALVVHVIVSWVFVYKIKVGIIGTAITLNFSWWVSVFGLFGYTVLGGCPLSWTGFSSQAFVGLWDFFKLSLAAGIMLSYVFDLHFYLIVLNFDPVLMKKKLILSIIVRLENFYYRVLIIVSGYLNKTEAAVDALSICITIYGWEFMIALGFLAATGVRVANELGAGNAKGAKFSTLVSLLMSMVVGLLFWLIIMVFHEKLAMIFTSSSSVVAMVHELALLLAFTILLNCIQPVLSGVAVGSGWQAMVAFVNIGSYYIVGVPIGVFLGWLQLGIKGVWAGMISGTVVQTLILSIIISKCEWAREAERLIPTCENRHLRTLIY